MPEKTTLGCGAVLLLDAIETSDAVSVGAWLNAGSRDEREGERGLAHFTEHMLFKGTTARSHFDIALEVDSVGGEINGATGKEHTYYFVNAASEYVTNALDLLLDMYFDSSFEAGEFEKERAVILDEIDMAFDDPDDYVSELYNELLWGREPFGYPVIGERDDVRRAGLDDLKRFYGKHYVVDHLVIAVAGGIEADRVLGEVERLLGARAVRRAGTARGGGRPRPRSRTGKTLSQRSIEQVYFLCGTEAYGYLDDNRYALTLLNMILGNSFSSRLFQKVRERLGLCYSISSSATCYSDVGEFAVGFSTSVKNLPRVLEAVNAELQLVKNGDIGREELETAKRRFRGNYTLARESNEWKMVKMAVQELVYGKLIPYDETLGRIERVTLDDVNAVASQILSAPAFSLASVGPDEQRKFLDDFQFTF